MLRTFMDIEASGLQNDSYPIEIAWSDNLGNSESFLLTPPADWTHWDPKAELVHGISRDQLLVEGISIEEACSKLSNSLQGETVFTDAADYDNKWLTTLFQKAQIELSFRIKDVFELFVVLPTNQVSLIQQIISLNLAPHRALPDCLRYSKAYEYSDTARRISDSFHELGLQNLLFICTANFQRSKTGENLFIDQNPSLSIRSAGVSEKECLRRGTTLCTADMLEQANAVFTFEPLHHQRINQHTESRFTDKIIRLDIPDRYQYMQLELVDEILTQLQTQEITNTIRQLSSALDHKP